MNGRGCRLDGFSVVGLYICFVLGLGLGIDDGPTAK